MLAVPLLREDKVVGGLVIRRRTKAASRRRIATLCRPSPRRRCSPSRTRGCFRNYGPRRGGAPRPTAAEAALADLRRAQDRLIQAEKMASLGQLTAGIAHEIKNPLNFVNNFADLSVELLDELKETSDRPGPARRDKRAEIDDLVGTLTGNLEKIAEHGKRADGIVKSMLVHSRGGPGERRAVDLNAAVEEALNLAYHGARAKDAELQHHLGTRPRSVAPVELSPQDFTRVFLNLFGNGFYAAQRDAPTAPAFAGAPAVDPRSGRRGRSPRARQRHRHPARHQGQALRPVLHHQASRGRHRSRPVDQLRHRRATTRRLDRG